MGVVDRFLARDGNPTAVNIYAGKRRLVQLRFRPSGNESGRDAFAPKAIVIPQSETEALLGDLLRERGGGVEWGAEFLSFHQDENGVASRVRQADGSEETVSSEWLVSCEGTHSVIREQARIPFAGKSYPLAFFLADVELQGRLHHGENYVWMHADGSFAALPFPKANTWRLFVDVTKSPPTVGVTLELIERLMREQTGEEGVIIGSPTCVSEFRIQCRMVDGYRVGRVFLAGDAAHAHSPTGGQGIVTGIQDATNLAWKLARVLEGAPRELLDSYEEERRPKAAEVLAETDRTTRLLLAPDPLSRFLRDYLVLPIMRNSWVQGKLFAKLAQLHVNYRGSSLSRNSGRSGLKAGDRAPDVAFHDRESRKTRTLFELLQPMKPIAFIAASVADAERARTRAALHEADVSCYAIVSHGNDVTREPNSLIDLHGDFRRLYGMDGSFLCLIRPDDHIGLFQRPIDFTQLERYLWRISPGVIGHKPVVAT